MNAQAWPLYRGTKEMRATPMTKAEYCLLRGWPIPADEDPAEEGYVVQYEDGGAPQEEMAAKGFTGYVSWSPADVFERAYQPSSTHLERMEIEQGEVRERLQKLEGFIGTNPLFDQLSPLHRNLLLIQRNAMRTYLTVLETRFSLDTHSIAHETSGFVHEPPVAIGEPQVVD